MIPGVIPDKCRLTVSSLVDNQAWGTEGIRGAIHSHHRHALADRIILDLQETVQRGGYAVEVRTDVYVFTQDQLADFIRELRMAPSW